MNRAAAIWGVAALAAGGVLFRPWKVPEAVWAVAGAGFLVVLGLLPLRDAMQGVAKGTDVYLFLLGMMLLSETARIEGLFDWLAARAARAANGSAKHLFMLVYLVGTIVTVFLSNDATAVVLTPAVAAMVKTVRAEKPLPYLFVCAFIANAASFVLPISNPANLVIYGTRMPPLLHWLQHYALPSLFSIAATYVVLRLTQHRALRPSDCGGDRCAIVVQRRQNGGGWHHRDSGPFNGCIRSGYSVGAPDVSGGNCDNCCRSFAQPRSALADVAGHLLEYLTPSSRSLCAG